MCESAVMFYAHIKPRAGVASTYVEFERSEKLYLVTCDHIDKECEAYINDRKHTRVLCRVNS